MTSLFVSLIVFLAVFTQSLTGFGLALVSMPLLVGLVGLQVAAPLVALVGLAAEAVLLIRYRLDVNRRIVLQLIIPSILGIPIGILALREVGEELLVPLLGFLILAYAVYAIWNPALPAPKGAGWAYGAGFFAGVLGGAYNTSGPPVIVYGDSQKWERSVFKGNLQGFFLFNSLVIVAGHLLAHSYTPLIWLEFLRAVPALLVGILAGLWFDGRLPAARFRTIVLILLIFLGLKFLILG